MISRFLMKSVPLALAVLTAGFTGQARAASIIVDGGFESSSANTYFGGIGDSAWTVTSGSVSIVGPGSGAVAHGGNLYAYLDNGTGTNSITQNFLTSIGTTYTVSYWVADTVADDHLTVAFGDQTLFTGFGPAAGVTSIGDYQNFSFNVIADQTTTGLTFSGQYSLAKDGFGTILDDVSVTSASGVPEPATLGFTGVGCLALFSLLRRKRAQA